MDGSRVGADIADIHLDAGYDFLRWRGLTGFALGGIGVSSFTIDAPAGHWSYVTERASGLGDANRIEQESGVLSAQVGFEQLVPLGKASANEMFALLLSLRGGYLGQFAHAGWRTDDDSRSVGGLPSVESRRRLAIAERRPRRVLHHLEKGRVGTFAPAGDATLRGRSALRAR